MNRRTGEIVHLVSRLTRRHIPRMRILLFLALLLLAMPALAQSPDRDLMRQTSLTCHLTTGGAWDFDEAPPSLTPMLPRQVRINSIEGRVAFTDIAPPALSDPWGKFLRNAQLLRSTRSMVLIQTNDSDSVVAMLTIINLPTPQGWPATYAADFVALSGYCN
jgi:hypothetical protein